MAYTLTGPPDRTIFQVSKYIGGGVMNAFIEIVMIGSVIVALAVFLGNSRASKEMDRLRKMNDSSDDK